MDIEEYITEHIERQVGIYDGLAVRWLGRHSALIFTTGISDPPNPGGDSTLRQVARITCVSRQTAGGVYGYDLEARWADETMTWDGHQKCSVRFDSNRELMGTPDDDYWLNIFEATIESVVAEVAQLVGQG